MGGPLALDGCHLMRGHNNQPNVDVNGERGVREEMRPGQNVWGTMSHFGGYRMERQKIKKIKIHRGLRRPLIDDLLCNKQPKTGFHDGGRYEGEVGRAGGAGEAHCHCFGEALLVDIWLKI